MEERIGNVCTGLSEETILKSLKQQKHSSAAIRASMEHKPCCICQVFDLAQISADHLVSPSWCHLIFHLFYSGRICWRRWSRHPGLRARFPLCLHQAMANAQESLSHLQKHCSNYVKRHAAHFTTKANLIDKEDPPLATYSRWITVSIEIGWLMFSFPELWTIKFCCWLKLESVDRTALLLLNNQHFLLFKSWWFGLNLAGYFQCQAFSNSLNKRRANSSIFVSWWLCLISDSLDIFQL